MKERQLHETQEPLLSTIYLTTRTAEAMCEGKGENLAKQEFWVILIFRNWMEVYPGCTSHYSLLSYYMEVILSSLHL